MSIAQKHNKTLLLINLFFLQSYLIRFQIGQYPTNLQEILIGLQVLIFIIAIIATTKNLKNFIRKHWIIITFIILTLISIATVPIQNQLDFIRHGKFLFFAVILTFIFMETFRTREEKNNAVRIMGLGAIAFGIFSLTYNLLGHNITHDNRLLGPMDSAVYLAFYLTPFFIYFTIKFLENQKIRFNLFCTIILAILIAGTKSMGAIGGSIAILIFYALKRQQLQILKTKTAKIGLIILTILAAAVIFQTKIVPAIQTEYSSLDERGEIWQTSAQMLKEPRTAIFGAGFGQFQEKYQATADEVLLRPPLSYIVLQPHNIFLLFQMQYGMLGLLFITIFIILLARKIIKHKGKPEIDIVVGLMLSYIFLHGLIDTPFFKNDMMILLILFMSISLSNHFNPETKSIKTE